MRRNLSYYEDRRYKPIILVIIKNLYIVILYKHFPICPYYTDNTVVDRSIPPYDRLSTQTYLETTNINTAQLTLNTLDVS